MHQEWFRESRLQSIRQRVDQLLDFHGRFPRQDLRWSSQSYQRRCLTFLQNELAEAQMREDLHPQHLLLWRTG